MRSLFLLFIFICVIIAGCSKRFFLYETRHSVIHKSYDTKKIQLQNYVLCGIEKDDVNEIVKYGVVDEDSLFNVFINSVNNLNLSIELSADSKNHCDSTHYDNTWFRLTSIDQEQVIGMAGESSDVVKMIPYVSIRDIYYDGHHFGQGGTIYREEFKADEIVFVVLLVYEDEIIYSRRGVYQVGKRVTRKKVLNSYTDPTTQAHWDTLVSKVMEDYIKRLEK